MTETSEIANTSPAHAELLALIGQLRLHDVINEPLVPRDCGAMARKMFEALGLLMVERGR